MRRLSRAGPFWTRKAGILLACMLAPPQNSGHAGATQAGVGGRRDTCVTGQTRLNAAIASSQVHSGIVTGMESQRHGIIYAHSLKSSTPEHNAQRKPLFSQTEVAVCGFTESGCGLAPACASPPPKCSPFFAFSCRFAVLRSAAHSNASQNIRGIRGPLSSRNQQKQQETTPARTG